MVNVFIPNSLYAVSTTGTVGLWSRRASNFASLGNLGSLAIISLTWDQMGTMWCIKKKDDKEQKGKLPQADGVRRWDGSKWTDPPKINSWSIYSLAFDPFSTAMWCVGTEGNVGRWNPTTSKWEDRGRPGGKSLISITFDPSIPGRIWCASKDRIETGIGVWDIKSSTLAKPFTPLGGWTLNQVAFDPNGDLWGVGSLANLGKWNGRSFDDQGTPGEWNSQWIAWGTEGTAGSVDFVQLGKEAMNCATSLSATGASQSFQLDPVTYLVTHGMNLGFLTGTQLTNLSQLISSDLASPTTFGSLQVVSNSVLGGIRCGACRISLSVILTMFNIAVLELTGIGLGAAILDGLAIAIADAIPAIRGGAAVVRGILERVSPMGLSKLFEELCVKAGACKE